MPHVDQPRYGGVLECSAAVAAAARCGAEINDVFCVYADTNKRRTGRSLAMLWVGTRQLRERVAGWRPWAIS